MAIDDFKTRYSKLNNAQRQAVDTIEGPVLVIAGPGTGKTELLTLRVANILLKSDARPENILCLTFTESAAYEMRQRLVNIVGQQAYNITISTYHAFGRELISRYPDYFSSDTQSRAIDELGQYKIISSIIDTLPYDNPFKKSTDHIRDILSVISECKRALIAPSDLERIAKENLAFISSINTVVPEILSGITRVSKTSISAFIELKKQLSSFTTNDRRSTIALPNICLDQLQYALDTVASTNKTSALTDWKNEWLERNADAQFIISGEKTNKKLLALAGIYRSYLITLNEQSAFDYDDMILRAIHGLKQNDDLRYSLQERYLYILLDEFQDTNGAQFELIKLLSNSPLHEGKPNVLAVGDDDQAIYAFQGADYSHMLAFQQQFKNVTLISLTENYRSHNDILHVAHNIAGQIEQRLHHHLEGINKTITAQNKTLPEQATIERHEFKSDIAQYGWIAEKISELIASGIRPSEIAILAPQHKYLEPVIPYLKQATIPVRYEKRENVLDDIHVTQLLRMAELVISLKSGDIARTHTLWPEVLSYDFWEIPVENIWNLSWQTFEQKKDWTKLLIEKDWSKNIGLFFVHLSSLVKVETLETMLDYLIGTSSIALGKTTYRSPFYEYNFSSTKQSDDAADFWALLSNLTVLRQHLREFQTETTELLRLEDFIDFANQHIEANIKILNTSPYHEAADAVQIMTAYKSKGLEFEYVFIAAALDEVWGSKSKSQTTRVPLPPNLRYIRYQGAGDDEKLRLFFVAITRAKHGIFLTSYETNYANRPSSRLKYLEETEQEDHITSPMLPAQSQKVIKNDNSSPVISDLVAYWQTRHLSATTNTTLKQLLKPRIDHYQLAPTHVNSFIDTVYGGPQYFFLNTILRFPKSPSIDGEFGNVIHETLEWIHIFQRQHHNLPTDSQIITTFNNKLSACHIAPHAANLLQARGEKTLKAYMSQRRESFNETDEHEFNFRNQGVFVGEAHLSGKIDKMIINKKTREITVVDYKTGKSYSKWSNDIKLHKYRQQLYMYKLLVEGSHQFADYTVTNAFLEFVEPDQDGKICSLELSFNTEELQKLKILIMRIWEHIVLLNFPDITHYSNDLKGTISFENDLINGNI